MFSKVLVANRGEIAVRAFRAATELGAKTVAVFPYEDRNSEHRLKADEAYQIGEPGHPVRAYLDPREIVGTARRGRRRRGLPRLRLPVREPRPRRGLRRGRRHLRRAAVGVLAPDRQQGARHRRGPRGRAADPAQRATEHRRRGARRLPPTRSASRSSSRRSPAAAGAACAGSSTPRTCATPSRPRCARRSRRSATPTVFLEEAVVDPRHIEVQILADGAGDVVHLFERDCSVQRRHQKVVEIAPAPNLRPETRDAMCAHAVAFARRIGYVNAGTVEFLLDPDGRYVFIEMNPRIQVEHTVTEEITDVDLVQAQMRIASGETLADLGLARRPSGSDGAALQCRITTEDPANGFRPDTGTITTYRSAGGAGVRLDGGTVFVGAEISAHFDSMLVKLTCRGRDFPTAVAARPARAGGVPDPRRLDEHPVPAGGARRARLRRRPADDVVHRRAAPSCSAPRIAGRPRHQAAHLPGRRHGQPAARPGAHPRSTRAPSCRRSTSTPPPPPGARDRAGRGSGPEQFAAAAARRRPPSRSPTRPSATRTSRCSPPGSAPATCCHVAPHVARLTPQLLSAWRPGAARRTTWRCASSPRTRGSGWPRCARRCPTCRLQMLLRGRNTVGYTPYPTEVTDAFVDEAAAHRHRHLPDLRRAQRRRRRCARPSRRCGPPARRSPRSRSATPAT